MKSWPYWLHILPVKLLSLLPYTHLLFCFYLFLRLLSCLVLVLTLHALWSSLWSSPLPLRLVWTPSCLHSNSLLQNPCSASPISLFPGLDLKPASSHNNLRSCRFSSVFTASNYSFCPRYQLCSSALSSWLFPLHWQTRFRVKKVTQVYCHATYLAQIKTLTQTCNLFCLLESTVWKQGRRNMFLSN